MSEASTSQGAPGGLESKKDSLEAAPFGELVREPSRDPGGLFGSLAQRQSLPQASGCYFLCPPGLSDKCTLPEACEESGCAGRGGRERPSGQRDPGSHLGSPHPDSCQPHLQDGMAERRE